MLWEKLYVCGGNDGAVTLKQVERYDPEAPFGSFWDLLKAR